MLFNTVYSLLIECTNAGIPNCDFCATVADGCTQCAAGYGYYNRDSCTSSMYLLNINLHLYTVTQGIYLPPLPLLYITELLLL